MASSIQPRKQRKARYFAPIHKRKKLMHVHIAKELRSKLGIKRRAILVRKGDKIRVRKGKFKKKTGIVLEADYKNLVIYAEGVNVKNARSMEKLVPLMPCNVEIIDGDFASKDRKAVLERSNR